MPLTRLRPNLVFTCPPIAYAWRAEQLRVALTCENVCRAELWDTAGQERFRAITQAYYRHADGIILVYDAANKGSFCSLPDWFEETDRLATRHAAKLLVGNKSDLIAQRQVSSAEAESFASGRGVKLVEASAKENAQVELAFVEMVREVKEARLSGLKNAAATKPGYVSLTNKSEPLNPKKGLLAGALSLCSIL